MLHLANSGAKALSGSRPVLVQAPEGTCRPSASWRASKMAAMQGISGPWSWSAEMCQALQRGWAWASRPLTRTTMPPSGVPRASNSPPPRCMSAASFSGCWSQPHWRSLANTLKALCARPTSSAARKLTRCVSLVVRWKQFQVWDVAHRTPAGAQALERHWRGISPSQARLPAPVFPHGNRHTAVAQYCCQRCFSSRGALRRGDAGVDRMDAAPAAAQGIHHG